MGSVFDEALIRMLHSGCALLVGGADSTGRPHASRGYGLTVMDGEPVRVRLLVDADDATTLDNLQPNAPVAITAASVPNLSSVQLKGRVVQLQPVNEVDEAKRVQYSSDLTNDIHRTDGDQLAVIRPWSERSVVACIVEVEATFDQTPGPSAGAPLSAEPACDDRVHHAALRRCFDGRVPAVIAR